MTNQGENIVNNSVSNLAFDISVEATVLQVKSVTYRKYLVQTCEGTSKFEATAA